MPKSGDKPHYIKHILYKQKYQGATMTNIQAYNTKQSIKTNELLKEIKSKGILNLEKALEAGYKEGACSFYRAYVPVKERLERVGASKVPIYVARGRHAGKLYYLKFYNCKYATKIYLIKEDE